MPLTDKHNNPLKVGDLLISDHRSSVGQIYRIKEIRDVVTPLEAEIMHSDQLARCVRVYDPFLEPKDRGNFVTYGHDITKVDEKYVSEMIDKWKKLFTEEFSGI